MAFLDTRHKRKSAALTIALLSAIILLLFVMGLSYTEEPLERGIAINFGTAPTGQGQQAQSPRRAQSPQVEDQPAPTPVKQESAQPTAQEVEEVLTETESKVVIKEAAEKPSPAGEQNKAEETAEPEESIPEPPKPNAQTKNVLSQFIKGSKTTGDTPSGEGITQGNEDQGSPDGNPYASTYYGDPTTGSGTSGYGLSGRSLRNSGQVEQDCMQAGRVVVKITVDRSGKVIAAVPGVRGTTNKADCLLKPAKETAFLHQWNPDPKAPAQQVGFVVVNFRLGQ
jgi:outer membrane biosynthesis protein TonB